MDFGGGFGIPYDRRRERPFQLTDYAAKFDATLREWVERTGRRDVTFAVEPGRFVVAECGIALASVNSVKHTGGVR